MSPKAAAMHCSYVKRTSERVRDVRDIPLKTKKEMDPAAAGESAWRGGV
jgi:hypothetical protein